MNTSLVSVAAIAGCAAALSFASVTTAAPRPAVTPTPASFTIPAGTVVDVRTTDTIASNKIATGDTFAFVVDREIVLRNAVLVPKGALGSGHVKLAGAAGSHGHEGNLQLVFDSVATPNGVLHLDYELDINGRQRKTMGQLSGFSPYTGFGAAVRGGQAAIGTDRLVEITLSNDAALDRSAPTPAASHPRAQSDGGHRK
jgi:hypothetical protein